MKRILIAFIVCLVMGQMQAFAQRGKIQYFRPYDKSGVNVFETTKEDTVGFTEFQLRLGANFTQGFQTLKHENKSGVALYPLFSGFPLAQANLNIDAQLADGVRVSLVSYMASHHHNEFWVKGGYFQIDKVGFLNSETMNNIWKNLTLKVGHMEINYGDAHHRRSDGGNTFWNPFIENNIMDAFTTEIGAELYWQRNGIIVMGGLSNGEIQGSVTGEDRRGASIYGKLGYDKQINDDTRLRITGSILTKASSINGTLFGGDRTGSNYQFVMEPANATVTGNAFSGRYNPGFRDNVTTFVVNPFVKFKGLEFFGTVEMAEGNQAVENGEVQYDPTVPGPVPTFAKLDNRKFNQMGADLIYRFGKDENLYVGARYMKLSGTQAFGIATNTTVPNGINQGTRVDISITRMAFAAGWFITPNIMLKGEWVTQKYDDFPTGNILNGGKFEGFVLQGSIAF